MVQVWLGMLGAALALALFGAGYVCAGRRRKERPEGRRHVPAEVEKQAAAWREYWDFLHYDGSEMPENGGKRPGAKEEGR